MVTMAMLEVGKEHSIDGRLRCICVDKLEILLAKDRK